MSHCFLRYRLLAACHGAQSTFLVPCSSPNSEHRGSRKGTQQPGRAFQGPSLKLFKVNYLERSGLDYTSVDGQLFKLPTWRGVRSSVVAT
ncbi:hypothetical protein EVAR_103228_1 [Eumeta japonica]|uniref:Uncharacterized protein n=1 Tax=Eumeta variegata TaxID=151549 RepID=A0A4C1X8P9_EUMVA|nr:hypothetical protein EVAR_103228_1 [Eumeta japonica]